LKRSIGWLTAARIVVLLLILLSAILVSSGTGVQFDRQALREPGPARDELSFLYLVNGAAILLGLFHWTVGRRLPARAEAYVQLLGDLGIVTTLVYVSGGPDSVFSFLYLVVIGVSAFLLLRTGAVLIASVAAVLYGSVVQLLAYGLLPPPPLAPVSDWAGTRVRYNLAITVAGFYGIAFMVSYLSEKLLAARDELALRQRALQRLQHLYGNVIATMSSGLMTADARQRVTFLNRAGGELLGVEPARAPGRPLSDFGFRFAENWEEIRERARGPETYRDEIELARGNERRMLGFSLRMLKDAGGEEGILLLFQDLTDLKKFERQARFHSQLAAVGELAAGIAHEIRNPLASISGSVQVLSKELNVGSAERRLMEIIVSESNRLSKILEDFLRFVRPQERRIAEFDVAATIHEVMDLFRLSDEVSDAHAIEVDVAPRSATLEGDRDQIRQIVYNVAKNAVHAMSAGGTLRVVGREEDAWYTIRFADTGRGMSEEELSRLFTPFSTAFDGGTGLGMAIVRKIVEDHGGAIDAESRPGEGTTVTVLLPRAARRMAIGAASAEAMTAGVS
jgi:two-component system sensor histidine kinase PilS (NtrC family)